MYTDSQSWAGVIRVQGRVLEGEEEKGEAGGRRGSSRLQTWLWVLHGGERMEGCSALMHTSRSPKRAVACPAGVQASITPRYYSEPLSFPTKRHVTTGPGRWWVGGRVWDSCGRAGKGQGRVWGVGGLEGVGGGENLGRGRIHVRSCEGSAACVFPWGTPSGENVRSSLLLVKGQEPRIRCAKGPCMKGKALYDWSVNEPIGAPRSSNQRRGSAAARAAVRTPPSLILTLSPTHTVRA